MRIKNFIKMLVPKKMLKNYQMAKTRNKDYAIWIAQGRPVPAPDNVKYKLLDLYRIKYKAKILVETGTYLGGMIRSHIDNFKEIHTIELMEKYYLAAKEEFTIHKHIHCHFGESTDMLKQIVPKLNGKTIYWLDAHYSVDVFARGRSDCPALEELEIIFNNPEDAILLIDDARDFTGHGDYPTAETVITYIKEKRKHYSVSVIDDIIVAIPGKN
jgi:hypothetical protein